MAARLGINIDHVATLRQARGENYPSVSRACELALEAGADQMTIHLREDRRHIQDSDVLPVIEICRRWNRLINLEMGCDSEILAMACRLKPDWVCLVPEKREEKTTEGGLNLVDTFQFQKIEKTIQSLRKNNIKVSLFVEAKPEILQRVAQLDCQAIEVHTGDFAHSFLEEKDLDHHFDLFRQSQEFCIEHQIGHHAGHGLTLESLNILHQRLPFAEYNIGHWVISESIFLGLHRVIQELKAIINR